MHNIAPRTNNTEEYKSALTGGEEKEEEEARGMDTATFHFIPFNNKCIYCMTTKSRTNI